MGLNLMRVETIIYMYRKMWAVCGGGGGGEADV